MTTAMMPGDLALVLTWTGSHASRLRTALRMTQEELAETLGVAQRTVAMWRERPQVVITAEVQRALDTLLEQAPVQAQQRFVLMSNEDGAPGCARCGRWS